MSGTASEVNDSVLTMEPEGDITEEQQPEMADCSRCGFSHPVGQTECDDDNEATMTVAVNGSEPFNASDLTPEQIAAGIQNLSGGIATAQEVENAARSDEGLPPIEPELPLDFGPFNPDNALKTIFEKSAEVRVLQADYDDKKEAASDAKKELDIASKALVNIIESLKNRRTQALNPSQPFLRDVSADAPPSSSCPWERAHPGQSCPICTAAQAKDVTPALESEVHPEHSGHAEIAEAARVQNVLEPLAEKLRGVNVFVWPSALAGLSTEELAAIQSYADEPTPMPPHLVTRCCIAATPGSLIQVCTRCEDVLAEVVDETNVYPVGAFVGFACGKTLKIDETHEQAAPIKIEPLEEAPRKSRSHAKKKARKTAPESERHAQTAEGKKRSAPKAKKATKKGKR